MKRNPVLGQSDVAASAATVVDAEPSEPGPTAVWQYPETRSLGEHRVVLHAPQIRSWDDFERFEGVMAIEFYPQSLASTPLYATVTLSGETALAVEERQIVITHPRVEDVTFASGGEQQYIDAVYAGVRSDRLAVPLDLFLASVDESVLEARSATGFNNEPPAIVLTYDPAILLHISGKPYLAALEDTGLRIAVNANWPLIHNPDDGSWLLLYRDLWLTAPSLEAEWEPTRELPAGLSGLSPDGQHIDLLAAIPAPASDVVVPQLIFTTQPTELIVIQGVPDLEEVLAGGGLYYVSNAWAPLLYHGGKWYYPVAGRWFVAESLVADGGWIYAEELPTVFADIPPDHALGYLRATVPGTPEARLAALEAVLPTRTTVPRGAAPGIDVVYDGEPDFQPVPDTTVQRAVNSPQHVLLVDAVYYLCFEGAWYRSADAQGPWAATDDVPDAIYDIPPESPAYPVTEVQVAEHTGYEDISYTAPSGASSDIYVYNGVPVYSTGWMYAAYYGSWYYPRYPSYGYGRFYNPETGAYGSRSVWYGPYGGYSYGRGYNPSTGRYGFRETAWNGDEFASYSEIYNERRDTKVTTERYANQNSGKAEMERTIERGDDWIHTERNTNFDDGWSETQRETSGGGSSEMQRSWDDDGNLTSSGTITTGDGRTAEVSGDYTDGEGSTTITGSEGGEGTIERSVDGDTVTREGEFTNADGDTIDSTTKREGNKTVTEIESSGGGELKSVSEGGNRTTVGKSEDGDIYAGHNGNVYKKTEDGWQQYDRDSGEWQSGSGQDQVGTARADRDPSTIGVPQARDQSGTYTPRGYSVPDANWGQVQRDAAARDQGFQRFESRRGRGRAGGGRRRR